MATNFNIDPQHLKCVQEILREHLTDNINVWVFGSRASNKAKKYSDLDLMLQTEDHTPIPTEIINRLALAFDESNLPWKVDIVDYFELDAGFKSIIDQQKLELFPKN